jgi:uncharacterized protein YuzE
MAAKLEVDAAMNAAYLRLSDQAVASTVEMTPEIQIDLDIGGAIVGVEVLDLAADIPAYLVARQFNLTHEQESALRQMRPALSAFATTTSSSSGTAGSMLAMAAS